jgi:hypothetical protein
MKMGPIGCTETSATNYQSALHNMPEDRRLHLQRGGSFKSHNNKLALTGAEITFLAIY